VSNGDLKGVNGNTKYEHFLIKLALASQQDKTFKSKARDLVREYSRKVKEVIGY
jgi:hypothetical protein